jgi:hypothetical protein
MKKVFVVLGSVGIVLFGCVTLLGIAWYVASQPPAFSQSPPIYPNTQNLSTQEVHLPAQEYGEYTYKIVQFTSADAPDPILNFYRQQLDNAGWRRDTYHPPRPNVVEYVQYGSGRSPPMYTIIVTATQQITTQTEVEIHLILHPGY